jgi:hypothetical protein
VLQPSSVSSTFVLQFIKKHKGLRVGGSEYKQGFLKFLYNATGGIRQGLCDFNWSEALTGQIRVGWFGKIFSLGLLQCEGSAGLECRWVLWPGVTRGRSGSLDHKCNLVCTCLLGLLVRGDHQYG